MFSVGDVHGSAANSVFDSRLSVGGRESCRSNRSNSYCLDDVCEEADMDIGNTEVEEINCDSNSKTPTPVFDSQNTLTNPITFDPEQQQHLKTSYHENRQVIITF